MKHLTLLSGALLGFLGVALGAFGAHALKPMLIETGRVETFELAVRYQFYHAFALIATGLVAKALPSPKFTYAGICFLIGVIIFSGSLYVLSLSGITILGAITPIGGVFLLIGWAFLFTGILEKNKAS